MCMKIIGGINSIISVYLLLNFKNNYTRYSSYIQYVYRNLEKIVTCFCYMPTIAILT